MKRVPKCKECERYGQHFIDLRGRTHWCRSSLMYAKEARTSPKWCPKRKEACNDGT